jgi:para-aminobenzoate synthetase component 1
MRIYWLERLIFIGISMTPRNTQDTVLQDDKGKTLVSDVNGLGYLRIPFILIVDFDIKNYYLCPLEELDQSREIMIQFPEYRHTWDVSGKKPVSIKIKKSSFRSYSAAFNRVMAHLHKGDSFLTNLTASTPIELKGTLTDLFHQAKAPYKIWYKDQWVCFSPETFIKINANRIYAYPMKGTIDATMPNARKKLLSDVKENAEHHTIVDLIRNDLSRIATDVKVDRLKYIQHIRTSATDLLQMSSRVSGKLEKGYHRNLGDIFLSLLPAGSISGAPKPRTIEIIHSEEKHHRGFYTGVCFIYDGRNVDSCVLIRFVEKTRNGYVYKSGGGITAQSNLANEFQELNDKIYVPVL